MSATVSQGINLDLQNHSVNTPTSSTGEKTYRYAQQEIFQNPKVRELDQIEPSE